MFWGCKTCNFWGCVSSETTPAALVTPSPVKTKAEKIASLQNTFNKILDENLTTDLDQAASLKDLTQKLTTALTNNSEGLSSTDITNLVNSSLAGQKGLINTVKDNMTKTFAQELSKIVP